MPTYRLQVDSCRAPLQVRYWQNRPTRFDAFACREGSTQLLVALLVPLSVACSSANSTSAERSISSYSFSLRKAQSSVRSGVCIILFAIFGFRGRLTVVWCLRPTVCPLRCGFRSRP